MRRPVYPGREQMGKYWLNEGIEEGIPYSGRGSQQGSQRDRSCPEGGRVRNPDGTMTLPPEMRNLIETHGELWDLKVENSKDGHPRIVLEVSDKKDHVGPDHEGICPVCKNVVGEDEYFCNSCGGKLS
jgi:hypothetical protein